MEQLSKVQSPATAKALFEKAGASQVLRDADVSAREGANRLAELHCAIVIRAAEAPSCAGPTRSIKAARLCW